MSKAIGQKILNYKITKLLGAGHFGQVYQVEDNNGQQFAAKVNKQDKYNFKNEYDILKLIEGKGVSPKAIQYEIENNEKVLIMELQGQNLGQYLKSQPDQKLSITQAFKYGIQLVQMIEKVHRQGIMHRDIKPDNIVIDKNDSNVINIVDFGISKQFKKHGTHIEMLEGKNLTGTFTYASVNTHLGIQQSRRDDLEQIAYTLVKLILGKLPWSSLNKEQVAEVIGAKSNIEYIKDLPMELICFLRHVKNLEFTQEPDYEYLINQLELYIWNQDESTCSTCSNEGIEFDLDQYKTKDFQGINHIVDKVNDSFIIM